MAESRRGKQLQKGGADIPVGKLKIGGVAVTATAAELNKVAGAGATVASGTQAVHQNVAAVTSSQAAAISASANDADGAKLADVQALQAKYNQAQNDIAALRASVAEIMAELIAFKIQAAV